MQIGLSYDLKEAITTDKSGTDDALEEYDAIETIEIIKAALESEGHTVTMLAGGKDFINNVFFSDSDVVFNIAEGHGSYRSREAQVPAILEMLDIPYTGSDPQCLAICLDKPLTKQLVQFAGVPTPRWKLVKHEADIDVIGWENFPFPAIVKPAYEGSSKGVRFTSLVNDPVETEDEIAKQLKIYHQPVMIEEFIDGDEVTVGIIGDEPREVLGIMRVLPRQKSKHFVYSLEVKRDWEKLVDYECPAELSDDINSKLKRCSLEAFEVLGCRDFSRIDFRVGQDRVPYFIEINPLPGLGTYSDLIIMAKKLGWTHNEVIKKVFSAAQKRYPQFACV